MSLILRYIIVDRLALVCFVVFVHLGPKHVDMLRACFGIIRLVENIYPRLCTLVIAFHISFAIVADLVSLDEMISMCLSSFVVV